MFTIVSAIINNLMTFILYNMIYNSTYPLYIYLNNLKTTFFKNLRRKCIMHVVTEPPIKYLKYDPENKRGFPNFKDDKLHRDFVKELTDLSKTVTIDETSKKMFELSNENVAFTGVYDKRNNKIYLYPLKPWTKHYETAEFKPSEENASKLPKITPIEHVQLTNPSHKQLCKMHELNEDECFGFAITKNNKEYQNDHTFSSQSISLNSRAHKDLFVHADPGKPGNENACLLREFISFLMDSLKTLMPNQIDKCIGATLRFKSTPDKTEHKLEKAEHKADEPSSKDEPSSGCRCM